jgi:hypothetical protein
MKAGHYKLVDFASTRVQASLESSPAQVNAQ